MLLWKVVYSRIEPNILEYFWGRCWGTDKYTALLIWNQPSWNANKRKFWACQIFCLNCKANHEDREIRANHNNFIGKCKKNFTSSYNKITTNLTILRELWQPQHTQFSVHIKWAALPLDRKPECVIFHEALEEILSASKQHQFKAIRSNVTEAPKRLAIYQIYILSFQSPSVNIWCRICGWLSPVQVTLLILRFSPVSICSGCFTTLGHNCRRWFPRSLWWKKFI
jgi:hypothetical protein